LNKGKVDPTNHRRHCRMCKSYLCTTFCWLYLISLLEPVFKKLKGVCQVVEKKLEVVMTSSGSVCEAQGPPEQG